MSTGGASENGKPPANGLLYLILVGALLLLSLWIAILSEINGQRRQARHEAERNGSNLAKLFEEHVNGLFGQADQSLIDIRNEFESSPPNELPARLRKYVWSPAILLAGIIDSDGMLRQSNLAGVPPVDLRDRVHFRYQQEHQDDDTLFIGPPAKGRVSDRWSLHMTRRLTGRDGQFAGAVLVSLSIENLVDFIEGVDVGQRGVVTLVGLDHVIRARASRIDSHLSPNGEFFPGGQVFSAPQTSGCYVGADPIDGEVRLNCWRRLQLYPFAVLVSQSEMDYLASWRKWRRDALLAGWGYSLFIGVVLVSLGRAWVKNLREMDSLATEGASLKALACTDPLTGVLNRRGFELAAGAELERAARHGGSLSMLILDIDFFKTVNDRYGHPAGDAVLRELVTRCANRLRHIDSIGRLGGEEFAVLLPETDSGGGQRVAEILRAVIAGNPFRTAEGVEIGVTISVGGAELGSATTFYQLLGRADQALYHAKQTGRDRVVFIEPPAAPHFAGETLSRVGG